MRYNLYVAIKKYFQRYLAPIRCYVCDQYGSYLCAKHTTFLLSYPSSCAHCLTPTLYASNCDIHTTSYNKGVIICFYYTRLVSSMIHTAKFAGSYHILQYFADTMKLLCSMNESIKTAHYLGKLYITYIPMHHRKEHYIRGYNPSKILATYVAELMGLKVIGLLSKPHITRSQKSKKRSQRMRQISPFSPLQTYIPHDGVILVVDDVYTTGTTMQNAIETLHTQYPTQHIRGICIARNK